MKQVEMHCHSTLSDGKNSPQEVIKEAQNQSLDFLALTDHDKISSKTFQQSLQQLGIKSCDSVEVSARNYDLGKSLHLACYANNFHASLHEILEVAREKKAAMREGQFRKMLQKLGFSGSIRDYSQYIESQGRSLEDSTKWDMAGYFITKKENRILLRGCIGTCSDEALQNELYTQFFRMDGVYFGEFGFISEDYEPAAEKVAQEVVTKANGIVSLAHAHVTFGNTPLGREKFYNTLPDYVAKGVNAVEINAMANKQWVEDILESAREHDLLITFGSDCHEIGYSGLDGKHSTIGHINPYAREKKGLLEENMERFSDKIDL